MKAHIVRDNPQRHVLRVSTAPNQYVDCPLVRERDTFAIVDRVPGIPFLTARECWLFFCKRCERLSETAEAAEDLRCRACGRQHTDAVKSATGGWREEFEAGRPTSRRTGAELLGEEGIVIPAGEQSAAAMTGAMMGAMKSPQQAALLERERQAKEPIVGSIIDLDVIFVPTLKILCERFSIDSFPAGTIVTAREDPGAMDDDGDRYEALVYGPPVRIYKRDGSVLYEPIEGAKLFSMTFTIDIDTFWQIVNPF